MKKFFSLTLFAIFCSIASFATPGPITGATSLCLGSTAHVTDTLSPGGTWSSSNTAVATIGSSGTVYGVSVGTTTLTYTLSGSYVTATFTVNPAPPAAITGTTSLCAGGTTTLSDTTAGGTWSSGNASIATVAPTGVVYGVTAGTATIYYSTGTCDASINVSVSIASTGTIIAPTSICAAGGTAHLTDSSFSGGTITGGTWSSSNTSVATIGATSGIITGVSAGTTNITYTVSGTCGTVYTDTTVTVVSTTSAGIIYGDSTVNTGGATTTLTETVSGGTWSCSNPALATIDPSSGVVTGVSAGTDIITYTVSGCGGIVTATYTVTVAPINGISGFVNCPGSIGAPYYGTGSSHIKVWLITYNPSTMYLAAIDSATYNFDTTGVYYQFLGVATDSYRVKAAVYDTTITSSTGYIPTYHTSSFYWDYANVINHTSGTADINEDINMAYGTVTAGPGFVAGYVYSGANRGTSTTGIPVAGMNVNILNSTTNALIQSTTTDATGYYSFSNLPLGTYYVFPNALNYLTTAYTNITLSAGADSMSAANFTQHTVSMTITPNTTSVNNINNLVSSVFAFPNPTNGKLDLQWNEKNAEKGYVTITDITGREIYKTIINMNQGTGVKQLDLSEFVNGLYIISVKSGAINYNTKIQVQH